jgi:hypothetical protein
MKPIIRQYFVSFNISFMDSILYFESGTSFTFEPILSIMKFLYSRISSFFTPKSGVQLTPLVPPITLLYIQMGKSFSIKTYSAQTIQDEKTCVSY